MDSKRDWYIYSIKTFKEDCVNTVLFENDDDDSQDTAKSGKIKERDGIIAVFKVPKKVVSHDNKENVMYEGNVETLKVVLKALLLCSEHGLPL